MEATVSGSHLVDRATSGLLRLVNGDSVVIVLDEEDVCLDALKAVGKSIGQRMRLLVIIVSVGAREEFR